MTARKRKRRFVADLLSGANLLCGVFSIGFAQAGRIDVSLLLLFVGIVFDGLDGAAARRFGGTRWGVYSDDVADSVSYALAPAAVLAIALGGKAGVACGVAYAAFTIGRLVYFTLDKTSADPRFFCGVPSTIGAAIVLCSVLVFPRAPAIIGLFTGTAAVLMVSFDSSYRHLGRVLLSKKRFAAAALGAAALLVAGALTVGVQVPAAILLVASIAYGLAPSAARFAAVVDRALVAQRARR